MAQEIAIRVRLQEQDRLGLAEYERVVGSVASVAALAAWLPNPEARLVLRGRGAEPVRLETVSYGTSFEMLVVLDHTSPAVERAAGVLAALIGAVRTEHVEDDVAGVAGEIDRLDRSAPRGRSVAERTLRSFLEGARADVLGRRSTSRVRAAAALVRLAEDGAEVTVERVTDALAPELEEVVVPDAVPEIGGSVVVEAPATPTGESPTVESPTADPQTDDSVAESDGAGAEPAEKPGEKSEKKSGKKAAKKADDEKAAKKAAKKAEKKSAKKAAKKADEKAEKKQSAKADDEKPGAGKKKSKSK